MSKLTTTKNDLDSPSIVPRLDGCGTVFMQTFLPHTDFNECARLLDKRRLGKQRVEAKQILLALLAAPGKVGWQHHPATKMWRGHELSLCAYGQAMCREWMNRGCQDSLDPWFTRMRAAIAKRLSNPGSRFIDGPPPWMGGPIHANHRSRLKAKEPNHYAMFAESPCSENFWPEIPNDPYIPPPRSRRTRDPRDPHARRRQPANAR